MNSPVLIPTVKPYDVFATPCGVECVVYNQFILGAQINVSIVGGNPIFTVVPSVLNQIAPVPALDATPADGNFGVYPAGYTQQMFGLPYLVISNRSDFLHNCHMRRQVIF